LADQDDPPPPEESEAADAGEPEPPAPDEPEPAAAREPGPEPPPAQPSLDEVVQQIHAIPIGPFLLSTVSTLASMAYGKLGSGQLDEARGAIDAIRALMPVLEGRIEPQLKRDFEQALANLQVAYADASAQNPS